MIRAYDPATHPRGCDCATCCHVAAQVVRVGGTPIGRWNDGVEALAAAFGAVAA